MPSVSAYEKQWLFNAFLLMTKRPVDFPEARMNAEQWLSNPQDNRSLRRFQGEMEQILYHETLPDVVREILKQYHDDYVEQLNEEDLEQYRQELSPRNLLKESA